MKNAADKIYPPYRCLFITAFFLLTLVSIHNTAASACNQLATGFAVFMVALLGLEWSKSRALLSAVAKALSLVLSIPPRWYVGGCATLFFLLAATLSHVLFDTIPHVGDTHAQYVHSKILASGHLYVESHKLRQFFDFQNMVNDGRYYSVYAPGHLLLLALGQLFGTPWVINPLMGALTVIAAYVLAYDAFGRRVAYVTCALLLMCPFVVFMSSEYMNNATCLFLLTAFLASYIRQHKTGDRRYAFLAGLYVGYAFLTRPQTTLPFALPVAVHALCGFIHAPRSEWKRMLFLCLPFVAMAGCLLGYNVLMNGTPWVMSKTDPMKFVTPFASLGAIQGHIGADMERVNKTVSWLHMYLFGWPTTSLIFVLLLFLLRGQNKYAALLMACCLAQLASLVINPFYSLIFGPRYLYETSVSLVILTALCLVQLPVLIRKRLGVRQQLSAARGAVFSVVACFFVMAVPAHIASWYKDYGNNYWEGNAVFYHKVMANVQQPALLFVHRYEEFRWLYFLQPPLDGSPVIVALDKGEENQKLMDYYPDYHVYRIEGDEMKLLR